MNEEKISKIRELRNEGKKINEISNLLGLPISTTRYWISEEGRKATIERSNNYFKNLPQERKKEVYKRRSPYISKWICNKYHSNIDFKKKINERRREYYKRTKK